MAAIDLSKAKVGDKFRTRCGCILRYVGKDQDRCIGSDKFLLDDKEGNRYHFYEDGTYMNFEGHKLDLVEQVFDETLDTIERDERSNCEMKEVVEDIEKDENQELQRRKEVVELAEKIWLKNGWYYDAFTDAETFIELKTKYLKDGKLC
jgi:hypothetical protein